jgi:V8-like Glu-specific endopeptidase
VHSTTLSYDTAANRWPLNQVLGVQVAVLLGQELETLRDALLEAYPSRDALDELLTFRMREPLELLSPPSDPIPTATLKSIRWAESRGRTAELISAARARNPSNPKLFEIASAIQLSLQLPKSMSLESLVDSSRGFTDLRLWSQGFWAMERRVCAIEDESGQIGTGFLIGPASIITNYHVVEPYIKKERPSAQLRVSFDHKQLRDGKVMAGITFPVSSNWLIDFSPYSSGDLVDSITARIEPDRLDYAIIRLASNVSATKADVDDTTSRGYYQISSSPYEFLPDSFLMIIQHPGRNTTLQVASDDRAIIDVNENGTRVWYRTNTLKGSSGSPCFDNHLELVALHHSGDPKYAGMKVGEKNSGIPLHLIGTALEGRGKTKEIAT